MKRPHELSRCENETLLYRVVEIMYLQQGERGNLWLDPDKEWDSETLSEIAEALDIYGLVPKEREVP